ncbi:MAG: hypothetical protein IPM23_01495 [Candidatus Melainabacteria bacterium]|nr:hypothetical protein [Candidatus Melainabacteria bacterium]
MLLWTILLLALAALIVLAARKAREEEMEAIANLIHTIEVNLSILNSEIENLSILADNASTCPNQETIKNLLDQARREADSAQTRLASTTSREGLGSLLSEVFAAMNKATSAHSLLSPCRES